MRILLIEDDESLSEALRSALVRENYAVDVALDGLSADHLLSVQVYDLVILDLGLPRLSGDDVLRKARARGNVAPMIILTARGGVEHKVRSLDVGADDYMTKPFELTELLARIRAILRRGVNQAASRLTHGRLVLDTVSKQVSVDDEEIGLRARELGVLETLLQSVGRVITKQQLAEHLYSFDDSASDNAIEVYVHRLRKKLPEHSFSLKTIRGIGYLLEPAE